MVRDRISLVHRRLAIIDLEGGAQPMGNEDDSVVVSANCEIYNYRELRDDLIARGHTFKTHSDTEVLVHGYEQWGVGVFEKLRGMFAVALVDFQARRTILARDHLGIKPLFWYSGRQYLAFASELVALRAALDTPPAGDLDAIEFYLRYRYIPAPHTVYRDVRALSPATWMSVGFDGVVGEPTPFWTLDLTPEQDRSDAWWLQHVERIVSESVRAHLVADVPFGVLLSGGVDSTIVASMASRAARTGLRAFSVVFSDEEFSEHRYAAAVAARCGLDLHVELVGPDALRRLPEMAERYGQPFGDPSVLPTWHVAALARQHVPMVLSGDGGDEAFAGYESYPRFVAPERTGDMLARARRRPGAALRGALKRARRAFIAPRVSRLALWERHIQYLDPVARYDLWRPEYRDRVGRPCRAFEVPARAARDADPLTFAQAIDFGTYLPSDILMKVDIASMAHGLEVRTPLVDRQVVECAVRLPLAQRLRDGAGFRIQKYVLKKLLERDFPVSHVHRPKQGFIGPHSRWLRSEPFARHLLESLMLDGESPLQTLFRPVQLRRMFDLHARGSGDAGRLWPLLVLGLWMRANADIRFA